VSPRERDRAKKREKRRTEGREKTERYQRECRGDMYHLIRERERLGIFCDRVEWPSVWHFNLKKDLRIIV
jgi:hypothetical protein